MRSPVPTPELIERVMVRDPRAAEILSNNPKCSDARCQHAAKFVVLNVRGSHEPLPYCGTHKNDRLRLWAYDEDRRAREERYVERQRQATFASNLATMLNDAPHNVVQVRFGNDDRGNVTLSRDEAQKLLAWLS